MLAIGFALGWHWMGSRRKPQPWSDSAIVDRSPTPNSADKSQYQAASLNNMK